MYNTSDYKTHLKKYKGDVEKTLWRWIYPTRNLKIISPYVQDAEEKPKKFCIAKRR
jgi:hypothetical protein